MSTISINDISWSSCGSDDVFSDDLMIERSRFLSILRRHLDAKGLERTKLRDVLKAYLRFSPKADQLINDLISACVEMKVPGRLDAAIDILSLLGGQILRYAREFLVNNIRNWNHLYPSRAYEPNDDYWYILLRAVAQSKTPTSDRIKFVWMCRTAANRHILEAVLEALNDIGSDEAYAEIETFMGHPEPFIAELASELVSNR
jgi:hypothetical protein